MLTFPFVGNGNTNEDIFSSLYSSHLWRKIIDSSPRMLIQIISANIQD